MMLKASIDAQAGLEAIRIGKHPLPWHPDLPPLASIRQGNRVSDGKQEDCVEVQKTSVG
jgi:hypothetical protein